MSYDDNANEDFQDRGFNIEKKSESRPNEQYEYPRYRTR